MVTNSVITFGILFCYIIIPESKCFVPSILKNHYNYNVDRNVGSLCESSNNLRWISESDSIDSDKLGISKSVENRVMEILIRKGEYSSSDFLSKDRLEEIENLELGSNQRAVLKNIKSGDIILASNLDYNADKKPVQQLRVLYIKEQNNLAK